MAAEEITIGVVGLGLMGGSAALKLRQAGFATRIVGHDVNPQHGQEALRLGIIDEQVSLAGLCRQADLIILAIPVNKALQVLPEIMEQVPAGTVVLDLGSTKEKICALAATLPNRQQFVACHPIAGTENTGPAAAFPELFKDKVNIICDAEASAPQAVKRATAMARALGMRTRFMNSREHDRHIAFVSHMSHISSFVLGQTVLEVEQDEDNIFDMAGSGFASTVRLAKSSPEMWAPIFTENATNILRVLERYINNLNKFKKMIAEADEAGLKHTMQEINLIRKVLEARKQETET